MVEKREQNNFEEKGYYNLQEDDFDYNFGVKEKNCTESEEWLVEIVGLDLVDKNSAVDMIVEDQLKIKYLKEYFMLRIYK